MTRTENQVKNSVLKSMNRCDQVMGTRSFWRMTRFWFSELRSWSGLPKHTPGPKESMIRRLQNNINNDAKKHAPRSRQSQALHNSLPHFPLQYVTQPNKHDQADSCFYHFTAICNNCHKSYTELLFS